MYEVVFLVTKNTVTSQINCNSTGFFRGICCKLIIFLILQKKNAFQIEPTKLTNMLTILHMLPSQKRGLTNKNV